jgi:hypothetical protein
MACLGASLLLLPAGVRSVRADEGAEQLMSVDPTLVAGEPVISGDPPVAPAHEPGTAAEAHRPADSGTDVIVLNTRGYNYGPSPTEIDPAALAVESQTP